MRNHLSALIVMAQLLAGAASADEMSAEAVAQREGVVPASREGLVLAGGYCFSAAMARAANDSESAMNAAEKHAGAKALSQYLTATLLIDDPPAGLPKALLEDVRSRCSAVIVTRLMLGGLETVQESRDTKQRIATVVKAVTDKQLDQERRHWAGCVDLIRDSARDGNFDDALLWADVLAATGQDVVPALDLWTKRLCERPGVAATLRGLPMRATDGWTKLPQTIEPTKLAALSDDRLLELLDRRPFDDTLIDLFRDRLKAKGHIVASKATSTWHRVAPGSPLAPSLLETTFQAAGIDDPLALPEIAIVLKYGHSWPIFRDVSATDEAVGLFKTGETEKSLSLLLKQFAEKPNADCANYIGACLLAAKQPFAAETWNRLAFSWCPGHVYAGVNLMRAIEQQGRTEEAKKLAHDLEGKDFLDDWGRSEVKRALAQTQPSAPGTNAGTNSTPTEKP